MAENPEFVEAVEKETQEAIRRLIDEQDWEEEEEDKNRLHNEYMKEFSSVLREMMPMIVPLYAGNKPAVTESTDSDREALEAAKMRHEATVLAVAKRRKEYPHYLTKLLGKTMRLKKNMAVVSKIDLPFSESMESETAAVLEDSYSDTLLEEANDSLLGPTKNILVDTERLAGLMDFAKVSLQEDPVNVLFQEADSPCQPHQETEN